MIVFMYEMMVTQESVDRAATSLRASEPNRSKIMGRTVLLSEHPEKNIKVDVTRLKEIVSYLLFRCHPGCSVARGHAIEGSDIDVGTVLTNEPTSEDQRREFARELRRQGFKAFCEDEVSDYAGTNDHLTRFQVMVNTIAFWDFTDLQEELDYQALPIDSIPSTRLNVILAGWEIGS